MKVLSSKSTVLSAIILAYVAIYPSVGHSGFFDDFKDNLKKELKKEYKKVLKQPKSSKATKSKPKKALKVKTAPSAITASSQKANVTVWTGRDAEVLTLRGDIIAAQLHLGALKYKPGKADGVMGSRTRAALERFQRVFKLSDTGELERGTARILAEAVASLPSEKTRPKQPTPKPKPKLPILKITKPSPKDGKMYGMLATELANAIRGRTAVWNEGNNTNKRRLLEFSNTKQLPDNSESGVLYFQYPTAPPEIYGIWEVTQDVNGSGVLCMYYIIKEKDRSPNCWQGVVSKDNPGNYLIGLTHPQYLPRVLKGNTEVYSTLYNIGHNDRPAGLEHHYNRNVRLVKQDRLLQGALFNIGKMAVEELFTSAGGGSCTAGYRQNADGSCSFVGIPRRR